MAVGGAGETVARGTAVPAGLVERGGHDGELYDAGEWSIRDDRAMSTTPAPGAGLLVLAATPIGRVADAGLFMPATSALEVGQQFDRVEPGTDRAGIAEPAECPQLRN